MIRKHKKAIKTMITLIKSPRHASSRSLQRKSAYKLKPFASSTILGTFSQAATTSLSTKKSKPSLFSKN